MHKPESVLENEIFIAASYATGFDPGLFYCGCFREDEGECQAWAETHDLLNNIGHYLT